MRKAAKAAGVHHSDLPKDNASREKVQALARKVEESNASAAQKAEVAAAFKAYEDSWPVEEDECEEDYELVKGFRLRGTSFLLTYNWDFFGTDFPDGTPAAASPGGLWRLWKVSRSRIK